MSLDLKNKLNDLAHILYLEIYGITKPDNFDFSNSMRSDDRMVWGLACDTYNFWHPAPKIRPPRKKVKK